MLKCQNGSVNSPKDNSCYFCLDSIEYIGLCTLRTDYMALNEINADLRLRFNLLNESYLDCRKSLETSIIRLEATNINRDSLLLENMKYFEQTTDLKNRLKGWRIFGVTVSATSIIGIMILVLT